MNPSVTREKPFGKALSTNQGIQFPLVELQTQAEMLRALIQKPLGKWINMGRSPFQIRLVCVITGQIDFVARQPIERCKFMGVRLFKAQAV